METTPNSAAFGSESGRGLTKREYFAAIAMQAIMTSPDHWELVNNYTDQAVYIADELIASLNKQPKQKVKKTENETGDWK